MKIEMTKEETLDLLEKAVGDAFPGYRIEEAEIDYRRALVITLEKKPSVVTVRNTIRI